MIPVACPTCHAQPGAPCMTGLGTEAVRMHAPRARLVSEWDDAHERTAGPATVTDLTRYRAAKRRRARAESIDTPTILVP